MFVEVIIPKRDVHKIYYYLLGPQVVVFFYLFVSNLIHKNQLSSTD